MQRIRNRQKKESGRRAQVAKAGKKNPRFFFLLDSLVFPVGMRCNRPSAESI